MLVGDQEEPSALRKLLRTLRGEKTQKEVAKLAGVSPSLYKKLETGRLTTAHLENLIRVAEALGAGPQARTRLIRLARPDLARMIPFDEKGDSEVLSLERLRTFAAGLLQARGYHQSVRIAVELLYASLQPGHVAFALERRAAKTLSMTVRLGDGSDAEPMFSDPAIPAHFPSAGLYIAKDFGVHVAYAPIRNRGRILAVLGLGFSAERGLDQKWKLFLETVAALLEARLSRRIQGGSK